MQSIKYLESEPVLIDKPLPWQLAGRTYTATGYGAKIPSSKCVRVNGRLRRVYVTQYGNAGSAWIILNGERRYLRS